MAVRDRFKIMLVAAPIIGVGLAPPSRQEFSP
jgi:hypothetical protein